MTENKHQPGKIPASWMASGKLQIVLFAMTVIYCISPLDFVPDILPIIGWLDDLGIVLTNIIAFLFYLHRRRQEFSQQQTDAQDKKG